MKIHIKPLKKHVQIGKRFQSKFQPKKTDYQPFFFKMTINLPKHLRKQGQENARKWRSFETQRCIFSQRKLSINIHLFDKRLFYPSGLSPDVYLCFRVPGTPPCLSFLRVENHMTHLGHHALTFDAFTLA